MYTYRRDGFSRARGRSSRILDITCEHSNQHITFYQKDGPGILKRMYVDRFIDLAPSGRELKCNNCKTILGTEIIYKKENRPAYRLFVGSITKKIINKSVL